MPLKMPNPVGGRPGLGGRGLSESVRTCQFLRRQVRCLPPVRLCLAGRSLRGGWALGEPREWLQKGPGPGNPWRRGGRAQPFPAAAAAGWGAVRPLDLLPPQREKGASDIHRVVVSNFLLLSRSSSEREQCPEQGPLPGGRPPSCARRCLGGHDGRAHGFDPCPLRIGGQWDSGLFESQPVVCGSIPGPL